MIGSIFQENYGLGSRREMEKDSEATPIRAFPTWAEPDQVFPVTTNFSLTKISSKMEVALLPDP